MLFIVQFEDVYADQPERLPERQQHMLAHLAFLAQHPDKMVASGALRGSQEGTPLGGIWIVNAPDQAAVEALLSIGPFLDGWPTPFCPRLPLGKGFLVARFHRLREFLWRRLTKPSKKGQPCR